MAGDDRTADDAAVTACVLDYFEGWFGRDAARMERSLHPSLAKRAPAAADGTLDETTAAWMIDATGRGVGAEAAPDDLALEVRVDDIHGDIASVVVRSSVYREYVHLARTTRGWRIVNTLYTRS